MATKRGDPRSTRRYKQLRLIVLSRDQYTCYYCGHPDSDTIDHIVPVSKSEYEDAFDMSNMIVACRRCNSSRGSRNHGVFLASLSTPPALASNFSPKMTETVHPSPMTGGTHSK